jgi:putative phage-type endonuclease
MIRVEVEQNTPEWEALRLGVVTASQIDRIITPTGKASSQADKYMFELIAEKLTGKSKENYKSEWMERGHEIEEEAKSYFEFTSESKFSPGGFIYRDESKRVGCSPDGIGEGFGLEIKCPLQQTQVAYLAEGVLPEEYKIQVQASLWITGFEAWHFLSYHPAIKPLSIRVVRDEEFIAKIAEAVGTFLTRMDKNLEKIRGMK